MSKSRGLEDLVWAAGLLYAGFQVHSAWQAYRSGQQAPALQARKAKQLDDIHRTLQRIEKRLARG